MIFNKKGLFGLVLILVSIMSLGQNKKPGRETFQSIENLSNFLCEGIKSDEKKVRAIHIWVTKNIQYDFSIMYSEIPHFSRSAGEVLMYGAAHSEGYVNLMKALLDVQEINSELVVGYRRPPTNDTILLPVMNNHAWIAINIEGGWKLADPAWDAGYVGYEVSKKQAKVYKIHRNWRNKRYRKMHIYQEQLNSDRDDEFKAKVKERIVKFRAGHEEVRLKNIEKIDNMPDFKKKIVFHWTRLERYFLINPDTFLTTHLPANPMWQLREDTIGIESFMAGKESVHDRLALTGIENYNFRNEIRKYLNLKKSEKLLADAEKGLSYNPQNNRIMAEFSYLVLKPVFYPSGSNLNKEIEFTKENLYSLIDTSLKYNKLSNKVEGPYFRFMVSYYRDLYKESKVMDNKQKRMITKALAWNEKAMEQIDRSRSTIERDITRWNKVRKKLYPLPGVKYSLDSFDLSAFPHIPKHDADSLTAFFNAINESRGIWHGQLEESALNGISDALSEQNKLLQKNTYFLRARTMDNNDLLENNHKKFTEYYAYMEVMYNDSLKSEMYNKRYVTGLNKFYKYAQKVSAEIQVKNSGVPISIQKFTNRMLNAYTLLQTERFLDDFSQTDLHFLYLEIELKYLNNYCKKLLRTSESQLELEEQKKNFIVSNIEITRRREQNKLFVMKSQIKRWKEILRTEKDFTKRLEVVSR